MIEYVEKAFFLKSFTLHTNNSIRFQTQQHDNIKIYIHTDSNVWIHFCFKGFIIIPNKPRLRKPATSTRGISRNSGNVNHGQFCSLSLKI